MPKTKAKKVKVTVKKYLPEETLGAKIGKVLLNYFVTQFILMILVGVASWGILTLLHVQYPITLAVVTGVLSGVPGFGMFVSTLVIMLVAMLDKVSMWNGSPVWLEGIIILVIFFVFNKIVDLIIAPIFLGKATKVNPLIMIILIIIGTVFFGVLGAILVVPLYLVVRTIIVHFTQ